MADVTFQHGEYAENYAAWELVEDACAGEKEVKNKGITYLPKPNPADKSLANVERYNQYLARAVYYNVSRRTLQSLTGACFSQNPTLTAPPLSLAKGLPLRLQKQRPSNRTYPKPSANIPLKLKRNNHAIQLRYR